jgi:hypothetical protein
MNVMNVRSAVFCLALAVGVFALAAAAAEPPRPQAVSGTVRFQGKPLDEGIIQFHPLEKGGTPVATLIKNGRFEIPEGKGPREGKYKVEVSAPGAAVVIRDSNGARREDPGVRVERIPAKYNQKSLLTVTIQAGKKNVLEFDLK